MTTKLQTRLVWERDTAAGAGSTPKTLEFFVHEALAKHRLDNTSLIVPCMEQVAQSPTVDKRRKEMLRVAIFVEDPDKYRTSPRRFSIEQRRVNQAFLFLIACSGKTQRNRLAMNWKICALSEVSFGLAQHKVPRRDERNKLAVRSCRERIYYFFCTGAKSHSTYMCTLNASPFSSLDHKLRSARPHEAGPTFWQVSSTNQEVPRPFFSQRHHPCRRTVRNNS